MDASRVKNRVPPRDVDTIARDTSYRCLQPNLPSILRCRLFPCDRDSHAPTKSTFQAQRIGVGSIHITMGGAAIKPGTIGTNFIMGGSNGSVET